MTEGNPPRTIEVRPGLILSSDRCAAWSPERTVVIADLHLGYEGAAAQDGAYFPRVQKAAMAERLRHIIEVHAPSTIVVNGDMKHSFDRNLGQEWKEIREMVSLMTGDGRRLDMVKGNHDNFLQNVLPGDVVLEDHIVTEGAVFVHGNRRPDLPFDVLDRDDREGRALVLGHEHPGVRLKDRVGAIMRMPCFLYHRERDILILPAFSTLTHGNDVLSTGFMSPIIRSMDPAVFEAFAVSEIGIIALGRLGKA